MEIEFKGGNCVTISYKKDTFVVDPFISPLGLKDQGYDATAQLLTQARFAAPHSEEVLVIDGPGEYEVRNCSVRGLPAHSHLDMNTEDARATIYTLEVDGLRVVVVGHINPSLNEEQLEAIGVVDVLVVPVGGYGYTLDAKEAVNVVKSIDPKIIIPTHYAEEGLTYEVPQAPVEDFIKEMSAAHEVLPKVKLKGDQLPDVLTVYQITRTK